MEHPDLHFMMQREIQQDRIREAQYQRQMPKSIINPLRRIAGTVLITVGNKIADSPRPSASQPSIGGVALAGRIDR